MKIYKVEAPGLLFLVFSLLVFTPADIIVHKFLELHSSLSVANRGKIFSSRIVFFNGFNQLRPTRPNDQNLPSKMEVSC